MFNQLFESLEQAFNTESFGKSLRKGFEELSQLFPDSSEGPVSHKSSKTAGRGATPDYSRAWSSDDFREQIYLCARDSRRFQSLPTTIDLGGLGPQMNRLRAQASDGNEYGRMCHMRLHDRRFEMGQTCKGSNERVSVSFSSGALLAPVIMMHTHPHMTGNAATPCHFSTQDFRSFLEVNSLLASIVIAPEATLMIVKTRRTPPMQKIASNYFSAVYDAVRANPFVEDGRVQARATQRICRELNLELYVHKASEANFEFHAVKLK